MENPRSWSKGQQFAIPPVLPPMLTTRIVHECTELPSDGGEPIPGMAICFDYSGCKIGLDDRLDPRWQETFPWPLLHNLQVDAAERGELSGARKLFSFGSKKATTISHLTLYLSSGTRIFQVASMEPEQLTQHLEPVTSWLADHDEQLQAVAS